MYKVIKRFYFKEKKAENLFNLDDVFPGELGATDADIKKLINLGYIVEEVEEVEEEHDVSEMTVAELKKHLDEAGVKYPAKATKDELIKLVE